MFVNFSIEYVGRPICVPILSMECLTIFLRRSPISLKHVFLWCLFFDTHLTTHHPKYRWPIRKVTKYHPHALWTDHCIHAWNLVSQIGRSILLTLGQHDVWWWSCISTTSFSQNWNSASSTDSLELGVVTLVQRGCSNSLNSLNFEFPWCFS